MHVHMCVCLCAYLASKNSNQVTVQGQSSCREGEGEISPGEVRGSLTSEMGLEGQEKPKKGVASHGRSQGVATAAPGAQPDKGPGTMVMKLGDSGTGRIPESQAEFPFDFVGSGRHFQRVTWGKFSSEIGRLLLV